MIQRQTPALWLGQFRCALCEPLLRCGQIWIERQRFFESNNGALMVIERGQIAATVGEHPRINGQNFELNDVIVRKSQSPVSEPARPQVWIRGIVKTLINSEIKDQTLWNKLIGLRNPLGQITVCLVGR